LQYAAVLALAIASSGCGGGGDSSSSPSAANLPPPLTCVVGQSNNVVLAWDAVPGAQGYRIHYSKTNAVSFGQVADAGNTVTGTIMGLSSGTTYFFAVTAYDSANVDGYLSGLVCVGIP
jgi:hypothetical protein